MNLEKTEKLLELLRVRGVTHFKDGDVEVMFGVLSVIPKQSQGNSSVVGGFQGNSDVVKVPPQAAPPKESSIPHHVNEVQSLLKLNDEQLVDKLFPDYTNTESQE